MLRLPHVSSPRLALWCPQFKLHGPGALPGLSQGLLYSEKELLPFPKLLLLLSRQHPLSSLGSSHLQAPEFLDAQGQPSPSCTLECTGPWRNWGWTGHEQTPRISPTAHRLGGQRQVARADCCPLSQWRTMGCVV